MSLKRTNKNCCFGGFLHQRIHTHDEDNGTGAELGLKSWAHGAGVQPEQVQTVVLSLTVLLDHMQWALGDKFKQERPWHPLVKYILKRGTSRQVFESSYLIYLPVAKDHDLGQACIFRTGSMFVVVCVGQNHPVTCKGYSSHDLFTFKSDSGIQNRNKNVYWHRWVALTFSNGLC